MKPRLIGSPARAGIDLTVGREGEEDLGFPRTRGDRPYALSAGSNNRLVPPHARG